MSRKLIVIAGAVAVLAAVVVVAQITGRNGAGAHPLGTEVVVGYMGGSPPVRTQLGLTVLAVRRGTPEELAANGIEVDPEDRTATPYYVDARFANKGPNAVERNLSVGLEDSEGATFRRLLVFGFGAKPFKPCPETTDGKLEPGESFEGCTLVLVPDGLDVAKVYFLSDNGPDKEPEFVYWATE